MLPLVAIVLPWSLAWRGFRWLAARGRFFAGETARAQAMADSQGYVDDAATWAVRHRLMRIVDHVDPGLSFLRRDRWMDRHLTVDGATPPAPPCVFVGFHYGTGFWLLRHLRRLRHRVAFLAAPVTAEHCPGQPLRLAFMRWRKASVERAGHAPVILVGGSRDRIRAALREGTSVLGLVDVPEVVPSPVPVAFLGGDAWFPDGLLRLAIEEKVPLIGYVATLDARTGARHLHLTRLPDAPGEALRALAGMLDGAVRSDPAAWHLWAEWPRFARPRAPY